MKPTKEISAQLAARLGPPGPPIEDAGRRGASDYSKLRNIIRTQKDQIQTLENEVAHFQTRLHRIEDGHRLELARLKKEVEYHKRLRQGADQRSYELEDQLSRLQQQQGAAGRQRSLQDEEKENQDGELLQSQLMVQLGRISELTNRNKMLESQVAQLEGLKAALENELSQVYGERDELAEQLDRIMAVQHFQHHHHHGGDHTPAEEEEPEGDDGEGNDGEGGTAATTTASGAEDDTDKGPAGADALPQRGQVQEQQEQGQREKQGLKQEGEPPQGQE